jgi:enoyl-[acyl-carrier protein] reductase II
MPFRNRVTELLGVEIPIVQAPMGWIARAQLASAVSNAGGLGIIETSSGRLDEVREEVKKMRGLTDKPWGINVAQAFVRDPDIVQFVVDQGVKFVTTSAGDPTKYCRALKDAGLIVFHVVPTLKSALKAIDASAAKAARRFTRLTVRPKPYPFKTSDSKRPIRNAQFKAADSNVRFKTSEKS